MQPNDPRAVLVLTPPLPPEIPADMQELLDLIDGGAAPPERGDARGAERRAVNTREGEWFHDDTQN